MSVFPAERNGKRVPGRSRQFIVICTYVFHKEKEVIFLDLFIDTPLSAITVEPSFDFNSVESVVLLHMENSNTHCI